jgi:hypothetical protein
MNRKAVALTGRMPPLISIAHRSWAPLDNLLLLLNLALFFFAAAALVWFLYSVILRRILRARRIANARLRRLLEESANQQHEQGHL